MTDFRTWDAWRNEHQPYEIAWWKEALAGGHSRDDAEFEAHWLPIKEWIEPRGDVLDIGCGPRPPFGPCMAIEPLAIEYRKITPSEWWIQVLAWPKPAEEPIGYALGKCDTVICWNALDHMIGWRDVLDNMRAYGRPGARFAISTDFFEPFLGHPGFERDEFMAEIDKRFRVIKAREGVAGAFRELSLLMEAKADGYSARAL